MRLRDKADVVFVSGVLYFLHVNSLTSCPSGWFGSRCNYKCRCVNNSCDNDGECTDDDTCQGGWFGPGCQYADMAYNSRNRLVLTDGNDSTCTDSLDVVSVADKVIIALNENIIFTWLRVVVQEQASDFLDYLELTLSLNTTDVSCPHLKKQFVDDTIMDMYCELTHFINVVTLKGEAVSSLCSVYVSGGRNVALKETALQDMTFYDNSINVNFSYIPALAVDGVTGHNFSSRTCSSTVKTPKWTLILSQPRMVHRYFIYNRNNSICDNGKYGRECEQTCNCEGNETCLVTNGFCPSRKCADGYMGPACNMECSPGTGGNGSRPTCSLTCRQPDNSTMSSCDSIGACLMGCKIGYTGVFCENECSIGKFGDNCSSECSKKCEPPADTKTSPCNQVNGACTKGCKSGYTGMSCSNGCAVGSFGKNCNSSCSKHCQLNCDHETGACIKGCKSGFSGHYCESVADEPSSSGNLHLIIGLCAICAVTFFIGFCMSRRRQPRPNAEKTADTGQPGLTSVGE